MPSAPTQLVSGMRKNTPITFTMMPAMPRIAAPFRNLFCDMNSQISIPFSYSAARILCVAAFASETAFSMSMVGYVPSSYSTLPSVIVRQMSVPDAA